MAELAGRGAPLLVDGAQAAGAIPVDVEELGCDFYTVSAQKWLLGPDVTGALYVRPERVEELRMTFPSYGSWDGGRGAVHAQGRALPASIPAGSRSVQLPVSSSRSRSPRTRERSGSRTPANRRRVSETSSRSATK